MQFNPDGSLKIGGVAGKKLEAEAQKMRTGRCLQVTRDTTKATSPKSCTVSFLLSKTIEKDIVEKSFSFFSKRADATVKLNKIADDEFQMIVGPEFSRCHDCQHFIATLREYLHGDLIEKKGSCAWKARPISL